MHSMQNMRGRGAYAVVFVFERYKQKMEALNMRSMHSMQNMRGLGGMRRCIYVFERYKQML